MAQNYFTDNFDTYTSGSSLGPQSSQWTTWSNNDGGPDDVNVSNAKAHSGSNSLYFYSASGNGPHDVVLDFGGVRSSGRFKYTAWYYIPNGGESYFNFQGGVSPGSTWALDIYFYGGGTFSAPSYGINSSYPQDQWFEFVVDCDLDNDIWEIFIDGVSKGSFTNTYSVSYLDLYEVNSNSEWYIDDVSFCVNNACNAELALDSLQISPSSVCNYHNADVTLKITNNSTFSAENMLLAIDVAGDRITQNLNLSTLQGGADTMITIPGMFLSSSVGNGLQVKAINLSGDIDASNDTTFATVDVKPSPGGSVITHGTPYQSSRPNSVGTMVDPDVVTPGDVITYEIDPPTGYSNSGYGSTWTINGLTYETLSGSSVSSSYFTFNGATSSANASLAFAPDTLVLDSAIFVYFSVKDLANNCDTVMGRYINVVPRPNANFNASNVCDKQALNFSNISTIHSGVMTYVWNFGDGTSSVLANPAHTYSTFGTYDVTLYTTSNYGYIDSFKMTVDVYELPAADFTLQNACEGSALTFTDASSIPTGTPSYSWDFGDGSTPGTGNSPMHQYTLAGSYSVTMTVTVNGCSDSKSHFATQAPRSVPAFSSSSSCNNMNAQFTNNTTLAFGSYGSQWSFGDGDFSGAMSPSHLYAGFGSFDVTLVVTTDLGCVDSVNHTVSLTESPKADFSMSSNCANESIQFTNLTNIPSGGANNYFWSFNGAMDMSTNPNFQFGAPGSYTVKLRVDNTNGCSDSILRVVNIDTKPIAGFTSPDVCDGNPVKFVNTTVNMGAGATYIWDLDNGISTNAKDTSVLYSSVGSYDISLYVITLNGCTDTASQTVNVNETPDATFQYSSALKGDGSISFSGPMGSGYNYQWFTGDGTKYTVRDFDHKFVLTGTYKVELFVTTDKGCMSNTSQLVSVNLTSVSEADMETIRVYPNPSKGQINLDLSGLNESATKLSVKDINGKLVYSIDLNDNQVNSLDLGHLSNGTYMVFVQTPSTLYSTKFLVVN